MRELPRIFDAADELPSDFGGHRPHSWLRSAADLLRGDDGAAPGWDGFRSLRVSRVVPESATVFFDGRPAAFTGCEVTMCTGAPAQLAGTAATVLVAR